MKNLFKKMSRKWKRIKYSKKVVTFCIIFIVLYTILQTYLSYKLKVELSPTLTTCVYAFFGTELCMCAITKLCDSISESKRNNTKNKEISNEDNIVG